MNRLMLSAAFTLAVSTVYAQTAPPVMDPLHMCYEAPETCSGFNGVTILTGTPPSNPAGLANWGFSSSPPSETGTVLDIAILIPDNEMETVFPSIVGQLMGVPTTFGSFSVHTFNPGDDLTTVLGIPASPPNPYSAYAGATAALDSGFTAGTTSYQVLEISVNSSTGFTTGAMGGQVNTLDNTFALSGGDFTDSLLAGSPTEPGLPDGTILTGFLLNTPNGNLSTAQSSSLVLDTFAGPVVPEPSTWVMLISGFGIMGLFAAFKRRLAFYV